MTMQSSLFLTTSIVLCSLSSIALGSLTDQLRNFEILSASQLKARRVRRSVGDAQVDVKEYNFKALGKQFRMDLYQRNVFPVLMPGFEATLLDGDGKKSRIDLDLSGFYEGKLQDEKTSSVQAVLEDNVLSATIDSGSETYVIEPSWPYIPNAPNDSMIIYHGSDLINGKRKMFCGMVNASNSEAVSEIKNASTSPGSSHDAKRQRRSAEERNTCSLLLVADHRFFSKVALKDKVKATRKLIALVDRINAIYRRSSFTDSRRNVLKGYGFGIKAINVYSDCTSKSKDHFNKCTADKPDVWNDRMLLSAFDQGDYTDFCLAHLFTHQRFSTGTLGLAYIGSDRDGALGGICSPQQYCSNMRCSINTGWTTFQDSSGNTLITLESHLVTAHELGHNMGSAHDPDTRECSPPAERNGKFLMYQYSVNGYEVNNHFFSPCSRRSIGRAVAAKAAKCFDIRARSFCGNSRREDTEQCDAGHAGLNNRHKCCASDCRLKFGAKCSPSNHACCTSSCQFAPHGTMCASNDSTSPCEGSAFCDGTTKDCPLPSSLDNVRCGDNGTCRNRTCRPFCEMQGQLPCQCDEVKESCFICCRRNSNDTCRPWSKTLILKDGRQCVQGICRKGKCHRLIRNHIERLWIIIKYFNVNEIGRIMWANVVGTIIFLSLIIWIPLSCFISHYDRMKEKEPYF